MRGPSDNDPQEDPDVFDPRSALNRLRRATFGHIWLILTSILVTVGVVVGYILLWPPIYTGEALIMAESPLDPARDNFYLGWNVFRKGDVATEVNLFTTTPVLEKVIDGLELTYDDVYHPFTTHAGYLWSESWLGKKYRKFKERIFPPEETPWTLTDEQIERARTFSGLQSGIGIEQIGETNMGRLIVRGPSPRVADMANLMIEVFLKQRREQHEAEARTAFEVLDRETREAEALIVKLEKEKEEFYTQHNIVFEFDIRKLTVTNLMTLESSMDATKSTLASLEASLAEIDRQMTLEEPTLISSRVHQQDSIRQSLELELESYVTRRTDLSHRFLPDSPEVLELEEKIDSIVARRDELPQFSETQFVEVSNPAFMELPSRRNQILAELAGTRAAFEESQTEAARMRKSIEDLPVLMTAISQMARDHHLANQKFVNLSQKLAQAEVSIITAKATTPTMRLAEPARPPSKADWPRKKLLLLGAIAAGLAVGIALALLKDVLYDRARPDNIQRGRGDAIFLARVETGGPGRTHFNVPNMSAVGSNGSRATGQRSRSSADQ